MARLIYAERAFLDLDRLTEFLLRVEASTVATILNLIAEAVDVLANHPLIGRPVEHGLRELVISRGTSGYVALYSYEAGRDTVLVLSIRQQREAGYVDE